MTTRLAAPLRTTVRLAIATAFGLLALSACGGGSSTPASVPADADVVVKAEEGIQWNTKSFTATATDGKVTIFAENQSALAHNVYVLDSNDKVMGDFIDLPSKGSSGTRQLPLAPGTYHIVCKIPGHNNMNAELVVS
jgi:plastocyanin